jgi:CheY-like chemotaxis protein
MKTGEPAAEQSPTPSALVVEDYDDTRAILRLALERRGFRVLEARNGVEAVEVARRERPRLILLDINLPVIDGVNALRRIRETEELRETLVVIVTAYGSPEIRNAAFAQGCNEFIVKPFELAQFEELLARLVPDAGPQA